MPNPDDEGKGPIGGIVGGIVRPTFGDEDGSIVRPIVGGGNIGGVIFVAIMAAISGAIVGGIVDAIGMGLFIENVVR